MIKVYVGNTPTLSFAHLLHPFRKYMVVWICVGLLMAMFGIRMDVLLCQFRICIVGHPLLAINDGDVGKREY